MLNIDDIKELGLSMGQRKYFEKAVLSLKDYLPCIVIPSLKAPCLWCTNSSDNYKSKNSSIASTSYDMEREIGMISSSEVAEDDLVSQAENTVQMSWVIIKNKSKIQSQIQSK